MSAISLNCDLLAFLKLPDVPDVHEIIVPVIGRNPLGNDAVVKTCMHSRFSDISKELISVTSSSKFADRILNIDR